MTVRMCGAKSESTGLLFLQPVSVEHGAVLGTVSGSEFTGHSLRAPLCGRFNFRTQCFGWGRRSKQNVLSRISFFICVMGTGTSAPFLPGN